MEFGSPSISGRGRNTQVYETGASPSDAKIAEARRRAAESDLVVVTTMRA